MVRDMHFTSSDFSYLTTRLSTFHFVAWTALADENLRNKARLWDKVLYGNL